MKKFAVFDIDGTLIRWQLYHAVVDRLAQKNQLGSNDYARLKEARMRWKNREHHESFRDYEMVLITIFESSIRSVDPAVFDKLVHDVIQEYKDQVYTYTRDLIKKLKRKDYFLLAISGSHHEIITELAKTYGFNDYIGTKYERENGKYSGKAHIASHHKAKILDNLIKKHDLSLEKSYAVGDSKSDAPMLEMVENPVAFNPNKNLHEIARQNHWDIIIERKNMIYQLQWKDGQYILAKTGQ